MSWAACVSAACLCVCPLLVVVIIIFFFLSLCSAFGSTPVNLNIKAAGRTHASVGPKAKGVDLDALGSVNGIPVLEVDIESFEEKPWRKPGSDLSDYFNYGFNEDTWKTYCEKQRRLRMGYEGMNHASATKIMVHQGRSLYYVFCMFTLCSALVSRKPSGTIDVIGGQTGTISRVEGRRRHNIEGNNIQVLSEPPSDAEPTPTKMPPFFPPNIPPPPFPPPPHNVSSAPPLIPPPRVYPPPPPGSAAASWAGVFDSAKAWEYYAQRDNERERHKERDRTRERGHEKEREREREHNPSSQVVNSEEDRHRHRDYGERGYDRHHHERSSREKEERHREKRHRDKEEGRHKSSSSSSRRRHESEEGDSHRRHKHKKVKRSREDKEPSQELSADQENQSEPTE
uniref:FIP1 like 1a (S. cerevisiae) n=1 Tax=Oncorhynchus kisutch TaxID=8019 RepID=A0A8C7FSN6_ONCKI